MKDKIINKLLELESKNNTDQEQEILDTVIDIVLNIKTYLTHIIFIVPILLYIAIYRNRVNKIIYPIIGVLAIFTLGYHGISTLMWFK